jgi:hypothetical protein
VSITTKYVHVIQDYWIIAWGKTMTRKTGFYTLADLNIFIIIILFLISQSFTALSSAAADNSALVTLISQNEDPLMDVNDLAFFLVTHDFDAVPKKDYVEVHIDDTVYKLVPNGQLFGLAKVTVASL